MDDAETTRAQIRERFLREQKEVERYVLFLREKANNLTSDIELAYGLLEKHRLRERTARIAWPFGSVPPRGAPTVNTAAFFNEVCEIEQQIAESIDQANDDLEKLDLIDLGQLPEGTYKSLLFECALDIVEQYENRKDECDIESTARELVCKMREESEEPDTSAQVLTEGFVRQLPRLAKVVILSTRAEDLHRVLRVRDEAGIALRLLRPEADLNALRQGFLLVMTLFDAAVFDIVRAAMRRRFFKVVPLFGKKMSLENLNRFSTFEDLRDTVIEEQLRMRYLKDILQILRAAGLPLVDLAAGDTFAQLIELVLRRNVHIHNRGQVDERYLEKDDQGTPKYNLYNLAVGDVAVIDQAYWELTSRLTSNCVSSIADWCDSG